MVSATYMLLNPSFYIILAFLSMLNAFLINLRNSYQCKSKYAILLLVNNHDNN